MRGFAASIFLFLSLPVAVAHAGMTPGEQDQPAVAKAGDDDLRRIVVTLELPDIVTFSRSPSGRMIYSPRDQLQLKRQARQQTAELAERFDLVVEEQWPIHALDVNCVVFRVPQSAEVPELMASIAALPRIDAVQEMNLFTVQSARNNGSPHAPENEVSQQPLQEPGSSDFLAGLAARASGAAVRITVIDTGADLDHAALRRAKLVSHDLVASDGSAAGFPPESHATAVIGLLLASGDTPLAMRGYVPDAQVSLLRACWEEGVAEAPAVCNTFTLAKALATAIELSGDIVNLSLSGPRDPLLERLGRKLVGQGKLVIAAGETRNGFPGSIEGSLLAAEIPGSGESAFTLLPGDRYGTRKGSSIDAARLTALAALLHELEPSATADEIRHYVEKVRSSAAVSAGASASH